MAELTDSVVCSICLSDFTSPKILECEHSFCYTCLENYVEKFAKNNHFQCPLCRRSIEVPEGGVTRLPDSEESNTERQKDSQCDLCSETTATYRCQDCEQVLCRLCRKTHDLIKGCRGHVVVDLVSWKMNQDVPETTDTSVSSAPRVGLKDFCPYHDNLEAVCYCKDCHVALCYKCFLKNHYGHAFLNLEDDDVVTGAAEELNTLNQALQHFIIKFKEFSKSVETRLSEIIQMANDKCLSVDNHVEKICETVRKIGEEFKTKINTTRDEGIVKLEKSKKEMEDITDELKSIVKSSGIILEDQSVVNILDLIPIVKIQKTDCESRKLTLPELRCTEFKKGLLDLKLLENQIGKTILKSSGLEQFNMNTNYKLTDCMIKTCEYTNGDCTWRLHIGLCFGNHYGILQCGLSLVSTSNSDLKSCDAKVTYKLHNCISDAKSIIKEEERRFVVGSPVLYVGMINCNTALNTSYGFVDQQKAIKCDVCVTMTTYN